MTDSKLIGRYVKWNVTTNLLGQYTKILEISSPNCYKVEKWGGMSSNRIDNGDVTLMPEGFDPNAEIVEPKTEYVPKGTKFDESWKGRKFTCSNFFGINCSFPYHGIIESSGDFSQFQKEKCVGRYIWNSIIEYEDFKWITSTNNSKPPAATKLLYKRGDILVSLASVTSGYREVGSLHLCHKDVTSAKSIHYTSFGGNETNSDKVDEFRLATPEETAFYHKGGRNIKDMTIDKDVNSLKALIVGNWYTSSNWMKGSGSYAKFKKKEGGRFYYYESIIYETHRINENFWDFPNDVVLADMKEVSKYLPDGHPDKIIEPSHPVRDMIITEHDGVKVGDKLDIAVLNAWMREGNQWSPRQGFHKSGADFNDCCEICVDEIKLQDGQHIGNIKHSNLGLRIEGYKRFESTFYKEVSSPKTIPDTDGLKIGMMIPGKALNDWCRHAENEFLHGNWQKISFCYTQQNQYRVTEIETEYFRVDHFNAGVRIKGFMNFYRLTQKGFDIKQITIKTPSECFPPKVFDEDEYKRQPFNQELTINKLTKQKQKLVL